MSDQSRVGGGVQQYVSQAVQIGPNGAVESLGPSVVFTDCTIMPQWTQSFGSIGAASQQPLAPLASMNIRHTKVTKQLNRLANLLPTTIAIHVLQVDFVMQGGCRFVVYFDNGRSVDFDNINEFPSSEDIARIALECP